MLERGTRQALTHAAWIALVAASAVACEKTPTVNGSYEGGCRGTYMRPSTFPGSGGSMTLSQVAFAETVDVSTVGKEVTVTLVMLGSAKNCRLKAKPTGELAFDIDSQDCIASAYKIDSTQQADLPLKVKGKVTAPAGGASVEVALEGDGRDASGAHHVTLSCTGTRGKK